MRAAIWYLRFPGATRNAGPFRFPEPISRRLFARAMCRRFGLESLPPKTRLWAVTGAETATVLLTEAAQTRIEQLRAARRAGLSLRAIGAQFGLSYETVRQLTKETRCNGTD